MVSQPEVNCFAELRNQFTAVEGGCLRSRLPALSWKPPHLATCLAQSASWLTRFVLRYEILLPPLKRGIVLPPARN